MKEPDYLKQRPVMFADDANVVCETRLVVTPGEYKLTVTDWTV